MALLELDDVHTYYGAIHALRGVSLDGRRGRDRHAHRLERRRQVDDAADDLRPAPSRARARSSCAASGSTSAGPHEIVELGVCQSPEGRRVFSRMSVHENLEMGAFSRKDKAGDPAPTSSASTGCSRGSRSARRRRPARCPAASSRCSRSAAR